MNEQTQPIIIKVNFLHSHTFTVTSLAPAEEVGEGVVGRGHCLQVISLFVGALS